MAITQQLARIDEEILKSIFLNEKKLKDLVSFKLLNQEMYLDLGWEGEAIRKVVCEEYSHYCKFIGEALDGKNAFKNYSLDYYVEEEPKYLQYKDVFEISGIINQIDLNKSLKKLDSKIPIIKFLDMDYDSNPIDVINSDFNKLKNFYQKAVDEKQSVVVWWD